MLNLYDVLMIFMLAIQAPLLSILFIVLYKKLGKILQENKRSNDIFNDRIDELHLMIANLSAFAVKSDRVQGKTHSHIASTIPNDSPNSESLEINKDKISYKNTEDSKDGLKDHSELILPQTTSPLPPHFPTSPVQIEKSKINSAVNLKNNSENSKGYKDDIYKPIKPESDNSSLNELKSLENEILSALKRLEETKSHLAIEKGQEQEQDNKNKTM